MVYQCCHLWSMRTVQSRKSITPLHTLFNLILTRFHHLSVSHFFLVYLSDLICFFILFATATRSPLNASSNLDQRPLRLPSAPSDWRAFAYYMVRSCSMVLLIQKGLNSTGLADDELPLGEKPARVSSALLIIVRRIHWYAYGLSGLSRCASVSKRSWFSWSSHPLPNLSNPTCCTRHAKYSLVLVNYSSWSKCSASHGKTSRIICNSSRCDQMSILKRLLCSLLYPYGIIRSTITDRNTSNSTGDFGREPLRLQALHRYKYYWVSRILTLSTCICQKCFVQFSQLPFSQLPSS